MPEGRLNLSVGMGQEDGPYDKRRNWKKTLDFETTKRLILSKNYPQNISEGLIKKLSTYPAGTYEGFLANINRHIGEVAKSMNN
jgi:hypothetical protein